MMHVMRKMQRMQEHEFLTVHEVARRWRVHKSTVTRQITAGELPALRIGATYRISRATLEAIEESAAAIGERE